LQDQRHFITDEIGNTLCAITTMVLVPSHSSADPDRLTTHVR
jgi:hypothetical protein